MSTGILLVSHGEASLGIKDTIRVIMGEQKDLIALSIREGEDPSQLFYEMEEVLKKYGNELVIMVDVYGGTPFNTALLLSRNYEVHALTGMNVPMVMEATVMRNSGIGAEEILSCLCQVGKDSIIDLTETIASLKR